MERVIGRMVAMTQLGKRSRETPFDVAVVGKLLVGMVELPPSGSLVVPLALRVWPTIATEKSGGQSLPMGIQIELSLILGADSSENPGGQFSSLETHTEEAELGMSLKTSIKPSGQG